jgi:diguanylate cyclase (GGDEF)-like protein
MHEQLRACTDELTGLNNRRSFLELASRECARAKRHDRSLAVVMIDVDNFKRVNDIYGHQVGDEVLHRVATIAGEHRRAGDILARYGGEEFILLFPESNAVRALAMTDRLRAAIACDGVDTRAGRVAVTVSAGVAELRAQEDTLEKLIRDADQALYAAKSQGRNRVLSAFDLERMAQIEEVRT